MINIDFYKTGDRMKKIVILLFCLLFCFSVLYAFDCDEITKHVEEFQFFLEWVYDMDEYEFDEYYNEIDSEVFAFLAYTEEIAYDIKGSVDFEEAENGHYLLDLLDELEYLSISSEQLWTVCDEIVSVLFEMAYQCY